MKMKMKGMMTKTKMMKWVPMPALERSIPRTRNEMILMTGWMDELGMKTGNGTSGMREECFLFELSVEMQIDRV
jgi:hypothetical protein